MATGSTGADDTGGTIHVKFTRTLTESAQHPCMLLSIATLAAVATFSATSPAFAADATPGTVIDRSNVDQYVGLLGPAVKWVVDRGAIIKVGPYRKVSYPPKF